MKQFALKKALEERKTTIGSWIQLGTPMASEILAYAGYDWLVVDMEHSDINLATFTNIARGMYGRGPAPMVRVPQNDTLAIRSVLDQGAAGVIIPMINNAEEAAAAVRAAKYPPLGIRGYAAPRCSEYGARFAEYNSVAEDFSSVLVMIETKEAVENIDSILAVQGIDGIMIGTFDLSGSYGVTGKTEHPLLLEARKKILAACKAAGKSAGIHIVVPAPERIQGAVAEGFTFLAVGVDHMFLRDAATAALTLTKKALEA